MKRGRYDNAEKVIKPRETKNRPTVVSGIDSGDQYYTTPPDGDGGFTWGDEVVVVEVDGEKFIRTDGNDIASENLGELPEF